MKNPFIVKDTTYGNYITSSCSVNKTIIAELPVRGIDDTVEGKSAKEIFSAGVILEKARENFYRLGISDNTPSQKIIPMLLHSLESQNTEVRLCAQEMAKFFGRRLALILLTLKTGFTKNKMVRQEWNDEHWEYWKNIQTVILVGGLTEGIFGKILVSEAQIYCQGSYQLIMGENSVYSGISGCATQFLHHDGVFVLADFGQTNIKRSIVERQNGKIVRIENLLSVPSKYMEWNISDIHEQKNQAKLLHCYITDTLCDAYDKARAIGYVDNQIIMAIASYTHGGVLDKNRGGYAKLNLLGDNYAEYLSRTLSHKLQENIRVTLVHDGTAVALNFSSVPASVCLTLGTFIGVGFTDIFES